MIGVDKDYLANLVTKINDYGNTEQVIGKENNVLWNLYDSLREMSASLLYDSCHVLFYFELENDSYPMPVPAFPA